MMNDTFSNCASPTPERKKTEATTAPTRMSKQKSKSCVDLVLMKNPKYAFDLDVRT